LTCFKFTKNEKRLDIKERVLGFMKQSKFAFHTKIACCLLRWDCISEGASSNVSALCKLISVLYCIDKEEISVL